MIDLVRFTAAILRIGLLEMSSFTLEFFPSSSPQTFSHHSAGVADLITTSFGGRNRKCAEAFIKTGKSFEVLEEEMLNGQKVGSQLSAPSALQRSATKLTWCGICTAPRNDHRPGDPRIPVRPWTSGRM